MHRVSHLTVLVSKILVALALAIVCTELLLVNLWETHPYGSKHSIFGSVRYPGQCVRGREGYCRTRINNYGLRGDDVHPRRTGDYRVLVLGDSYTEGIQVSDSDLYTSRLEGILNRSGIRSDVINAGISGRTPADYIALAPVLKREFAPDLVVIQLETMDLHEDLLNQSKRHYIRQVDRSYELVSGSPPGDADVTPKPGDLRQAIAGTAIVNRARFLMAQQGGDSPAPAKKVQSTPKQFDPQMLKWVVSRLAEQYRPLVLMYIPSDEMTSDPNRVPDTEKALEAECRRQGVQLMNMRTTFRDYQRRTHRPVYGFHNTLPGDGHTNGYAHQLMAGELASFIQGRVEK